MNNQPAAGSAGTSSAGVDAGSASASSAGAMSVPPANVVPACVSHAGQYVCDGSNLYHCGDMGSSTSSDMCQTSATCLAGIASGKCGICEPNDYKCNDATPQSCNSMGEWEMLKPCASAELCTQGIPKHSCDPSKCGAGAFDCTAGVLRQCKADFTDWDQGSPCDMDLCDAKAGKCNECKPGSAALCGDPKTVTTCGDDGKKTTKPCTGATPDCLMGKCVACTSDSQCKAPNDCQTATCDMGSGTCKTTLNPAHSSCKLGGRNDAVCDYLGNCLACVDDSDCHSAALQCNALLGCIQRAPLQATAGLPGAYGVTVAPGKTVRATATGCTTAPAIGANFSGPCAISAGSDCKLVADPNNATALTVTVTGPAGGICIPSLGGNTVTLPFTNPGSGGMAPASYCDCIVTLTAQ
jgi:hypothetical protein